MSYDKTSGSSSHSDSSSHAGAGGRAPGKRSLTSALPVKRGPSAAELQSDANFASGDAVDALVQLCARRVDDAAEQVRGIGDAVRAGGDGGRGRDDYRDMAQEIVDKTGKRATEDLDEIFRLLDRSHALLGAIGANQLNGARVRLWNAVQGAHLGLVTAPLIPFNLANEKLHERIGIKATGATSETAPANKKDEKALLKAAILINLEAATKEARFVRASLPVRLVDMMKRPVKAAWAHLQEAYQLMQELQATKEYRSQVRTATAEINGLIDDVKDRQPELLQWSEFKEEGFARTVRNLHVILLKPWKG